MYYLNLSSASVSSMITIEECYFVVGPSEIVVALVPGMAPRIRRGVDQTLVLDAGNLSYDPDYPEIKV